MPVTLTQLEMLLIAGASAAFASLLTKWWLNSNYVGKDECQVQREKCGGKQTMERELELKDIVASIRELNAKLDARNERLEAQGKWIQLIARKFKIELDENYNGV